MQTFQFKPRHPVQQVGFSHDNAYFITAQPQVGVSVRERVAGEVVAKHEIKNSSWISKIDISPFDNQLVVGEMHLSWEGSNISCTSLELPWSSSCVGYGSSGLITALRTVGGYYVSERKPTEISPNFRVVNYEGEFNDESLTFDSWMVCCPYAKHLLLARRAKYPLFFEFDTGKLLAQIGSRLSVGAGYPPLNLRWQDYNAVFSQSGNRLAVIATSELTVFDLDSFKAEKDSGVPVLSPILTLERPDPSIHGSAADKAAKFWNPPVAFTPCGRYLLTLGLRNRVQKWDIFGGGMVAEWGWRMERIDCLAVSWDGLTAIAGGALGKVVLWDLE